MEIYFSPLYDSSVFLTAEDCGLGRVFVGADALLAELELRYGLTAIEEEHSQRVISYVEAMREASMEGTQKDSEYIRPFYLDSFNQDDYGTAELMLGWRDALVRAGWDGKADVASEKVRWLSIIEERFDNPGRADRWKEILAESANRPILGPSDCIKVCCPKGALDAALARLLDNIAKNSGTAAVKYMAEEELRMPETEIMEFRDEYKAHEWIASQNLTSADVVAETDPALIGDFLNSFGKPKTGVTDKGIGAIMRLLPLGVALFRYPADISALQSFLQSPRNPIGKLWLERQDKNGKNYYVKASTALLEHICSNGGLGDEWDKIISEAKFTRNGESISTREYNKAVAFLNLWDKSKRLPAGMADVEEVKKFVDGLGRWAAAGIVPGSELNCQFQALYGSCEAMKRLLDGVSASAVEVERLCRWASHLTVPVDISDDYARLGSINIVPDPADIHSKANHLLWFASATANELPYEYEFLTKSEIGALTKAGLLITDRESAAKNLNTLKLLGLSRCSKASIITCRKISGVETTPSAALAEISKNLTAKEGTEVVKTDVGAVSTNFGKAISHKFDSRVIKGFKRDTESYSSISTLIQSPVDYILDYVKGYTQYGSDEIADVPTTEGTVAHAYIERLGADCGSDPQKMLRQHRAGFDARLEKVISEKGLILFLRENTLELKSFKVSLRDSIEVLLGIIISNGLSIEGFEKKIVAEDLIGDTEIGTNAAVYAAIDCLLRDPSDGKYLIFDFKYNSGMTYEKKIKENRELQLAVYKRVVEKTLGEVKFTGYYAIPRKTLFTADKTLRQNDAVEVVIKDSDQNLFRMASKGYDFRWEQLRDGILEEAEGLELADIDYYNNQDRLGLYPLEEDYNNPNLKGTAYGNKNITLKGGLK